MNRPRLAVIGAGWAGLAAAVQGVRHGHRVSVFEAAKDPGGRARAMATPSGQVLDNGQHLMIGAYTETLALMQAVGVDIQQAFLRHPLVICTPDGDGLRLPTGPVSIGFLRAVLGWRSLPLGHRWQLLRFAAACRWRRFECPRLWRVADLCKDLPATVIQTFIEPLCVAALNTSASQASAQVFLTVLRDALFGGPGAADLLMPRWPLSRLLPEPAWRWLGAHGASLHLRHAVRELRPDATGWQVDGQAFDRVILATGSAPAARLVQAVAPQWAQQATALPQAPIVTVWLHAPSWHWPLPMLRFPDGPGCPAQFGFDLGALQGLSGHYALVVSDAERWLDAGLPACGESVRRQMLAAFGKLAAPGEVQVIATRADKRATFVCSPALARPPAWVAPGLVAAGDYVAGPYPATLEGAVRSGLAAVDLL